MAMRPSSGGVLRGSAIRDGPWTSTGWVSIVVVVTQLELVVPGAAATGCTLIPVMETSRRPAAVSAPVIGSPDGLDRLACSTVCLIVRDATVGPF
jgi:hypothetical protein